MKRCLLLLLVGLFFCPISIQAKNNILLIDGKRVELIDSDNDGWLEKVVSGQQIYMSAHPQSSKLNRKDCQWFFFHRYEADGSGAMIGPFEEAAVFRYQALYRLGPLNDLAMILMSRKPRSLSEAAKFNKCLLFLEKYCSPEIGRQIKFFWYFQTKE